MSEQDKTYFICNSEFWLDEAKGVFVTTRYGGGYISKDRVEKEGLPVFPLIIELVDGYPYMVDADKREYRAVGSGYEQTISFDDRDKRKIIGELAAEETKAAVDLVMNGKGPLKGLTQAAMFSRKTMRAEDAFWMRRLEGVEYRDNQYAFKGFLDNQRAFRGIGGEYVLDKAGARPMCEAERLCRGLEWHPDELVRLGGKPFWKLVDQPLYFSHEDGRSKSMETAKREGLVEEKISLSQFRALCRDERMRELSGRDAFRIEVFVDNKEAVHDLKERRFEIDGKVLSESVVDKEGLLVAAHLTIGIGEKLYFLDPVDRDLTRVGDPKEVIKCDDFDRKIGGRVELHIPVEDVLERLLLKEYRYGELLAREEEYER